MELYTKASPLVQGVLGEDDWNNKGSGKESTGEMIYNSGGTPDIGGRD